MTYTNDDLAWISLHGTNVPESKRLAQAMLDERSERIKADESRVARKMNAAENSLGSWLSAALDDPKVCQEMKQDILNWFDSFVIPPTQPSTGQAEVLDPTLPTELDSLRLEVTDLTEERDHLLETLIYQAKSESHGGDDEDGLPIGFSKWYAQTFPFTPRRNSIPLKEFLHRRINDCERAWRAAYSIHPAEPAQAAQVPEGWVLVPREPTVEMLMAMPSLPALPADKPWPTITPHQMSNYLRWQAALAAAPTPAKDSQ